MLAALMSLLLFNLHKSNTYKKTFNYAVFFSYARYAVMHILKKLSNNNVLLLPPKKIYDLNFIGLPNFMS